MASIKSLKKTKEVEKEAKEVKKEKKDEEPKVETTKNIIHTYSQGKEQNVRLEVPEFGFMMKPKSENGECKIRINFQTQNKSFAQTGFGSYYLDESRMLTLIAFILNGTFDKREEKSRKEGGKFLTPIFEDSKPGQGDEYKYFTIIPGMKEGKILVKYVCRDLKTKKQLASIQVPLDKEDFIGKMMQIYLAMKK